MRKTASVSFGALAVKAILAGISNTRDCDLVCYRHSGTVPN